MCEGKKSVHKEREEEKRGEKKKSFDGKHLIHILYVCTCGGGKQVLILFFFSALYKQSSVAHLKGYDTICVYVW